MSRAFVKEQDDVGVTLADRPVSPHPNLVTARGLRQIEETVAQLRNDLAATADEASRSRIARELRYWTARRASAQLVEPAAAPDKVVVGVGVTGRRPDGRTTMLRIVGEDEADPASGRIAWTSPLARALLGAEAGDVVSLPNGELEVVKIEATEDV